jgi:hypothetical protein
MVESEKYKCVNSGDESDKFFIGQLEQLVVCLEAQAFPNQAP